MVLLGFFLYRFYYEKEVNENNFHTVAFTNDYYHAYRGSMTMRFKYRYKGKIYDGIKSINGDPMDFLYNIYDIKISKNKPEKYIISVDKKSSYQYSIIDSCFLKMPIRRTEKSNFKITWIFIRKNNLMKDKNFKNQIIGALIIGALTY